MFRKTTLKSGLRVITKNLPGTASVTVLVLVGAGSRYETQELRGISHFLEHMFFKGADRYKNTRQVSEAIDGIGGEFNAFTGKEYAGYYVKVAGRHVDTACDVLGDMLVNSKFDPVEIDKERGVILEEYNMYQDTPMYQIGWNFERLVFGDQPLGWDQIGTKKLINEVTHDGFVDYKNKLYTSDNTVVTICGDIEHEKAVALVEKYFGLVGGNKAFEFSGIKDIDGGKISLTEKKTEQAHVAVGFPSYSEGHPDHWAVKLLAVVLGGNMSSRMFLGVREAKGLSYYISTSTDNYFDGGAIVTNAGVDLKRAHEAITAIIEQYKILLDDGVPEQELKKSKEFLKGKMILGLENSEEYAHLLGKYELLMNKALDLDDIFKLIDSVTVDDLGRVAKDIFVEDKMKLAVIGPYSDEETFIKLLKF